MDTSALAKLVLREPQSRALAAELRRRRQRTSSVLARVELMRAVRRRGLGRTGEQLAERLLDRLVLIDLTTEIVRVASRIAPPDLRTLDAVHLATALSLGEALEAIVTYDRRLASAAATEGVHVIAPR